MCGFCTAERKINFPTNGVDLDPVGPGPVPVALVNMVLVALWCNEVSYVGCPNFPNMCTVQKCINLSD